MCKNIFVYNPRLVYAFSNTQRARSLKRKRNTSNNNLDGKTKGTGNGNEIVN